MARKVKCPNCRGEAWTASPQVELPCPYCGKLFAKGEVIEKRANQLSGPRLVSVVRTPMSPEKRPMEDTILHELRRLGKGDRMTVINTNRHKSLYGVCMD